MKGYNIYLRKDGRWEGRVSKPSENGKRKYRSFFGQTKEAVRQLIDEYYREQTRNVSLPFSRIFYEWFNGVKYHIKESTAANYTITTRHMYTRSICSSRFTENVLDLNAIMNRTSIQMRVIKINICI